VALSRAIIEIIEPSIVILSSSMTDIAAVDAVPSREITAEAVNSITNSITAGSSRSIELGGSSISLTVPISNFKKSDAANSADKFNIFI
jgi:CheY-specific phosphatase CheX